MTTNMPTIAAPNAVPAISDETITVGVPRPLRFDDSGQPADVGAGGRPHETAQPGRSGKAITPAATVAAISTRRR